MYTDVAGYKQVGTLMQETAVAIEAAGLGPVMHLLLKNPKNLRPAQSIHAWFADADNHTLIEQLKAHGLNFDSARQKNAEGILVGKTVVLTGALPGLSRDEATQMIESAGGRTSSSVSKKTDFVLAGEATGSKYVKAKELGLSILDERAFRELLG